MNLKSELLKGMRVIAALASVIASVATAETKLTDGDLTVEVFSSGASVVRGGAGMKMFSNRDVTLKKFPDELNGFLGIQTAVTKVETVIDFSVNQPVRVFGSLDGITSLNEAKGRAAGVVPDGWKFYAFEAPFRDGVADLYYRDFPAGQHKITIGSMFFVPAIVPTSRLTPAMRVIPSLDRPAGREYFQPGDEAGLVLNVDNQTDAPQQLKIAWKDIPTANRKVSGGTLDTTAKPGHHTVPLALGKLTERGVHRVEIVVTSPLKTWRLWAPVGVFPKPEKRVAWSDNTFPIGLYLKPSLVTGKFGMYTEPYLRAACDELSRRGFNVVKETRNLKELDIAAEYGMKGITFLKDHYSPAMIHHPAMLAVMVVDEADVTTAAYVKQCSDEITAIRPDLPVVTCEVGESMGDYTKGDPLRVWPILDAKLRMIRHYPFRKADYDLVRYQVYRGWLSPDNAMRAAEAACGTPYWFVAQSFGFPVSERRPEPWWRIPNGTELRAQLHLALARGSQGLLFYTYENESEMEAMVDVATHEPYPNGLLDTATEFAQLTGKHGALLKVLRFGGDETIPSQMEVLAIPRSRGEGPTLERYIYLVNLNAKKANAGELLFGLKAQPFAVAEDVYTGKRLQPSKTNGRISLRYELAPGSGALLRLATQ